jgi:chorismate synthase
MLDDQGMRIRLGLGRSDFEACVLLQRAVWGLADLEITSALQLTALVHAGGFLHLAETGAGQAVGFCFAFPALRGGVAHFHSDMLAVLPEHQKHGLGIRLKWAQREEALLRGVSLITWTFDPLQARNAHLNLRRLGATASEFRENFYGITSSSIHHGLPTDRLVGQWELDSDRVRALSAAGDLPATVAAPVCPRVNDVKWQAGWAVSTEPRLDLEAPELLLEIPPEWDVLCQAAPRVAEDWHRKVRRALETYLGRGYRASDFAPTEEGGRRRPLYILARR